MQPAVCARLVQQEAERVELKVDELIIMSGSDDLKDAYRRVPVAADQLRLNVVGVHTPDGWQYQVLYGHQFGMASAVLNFKRLSRFSEAACRRVLGLMASFYFDDPNLMRKARVYE